MVWSSALLLMMVPTVETGQPTRRAEPLRALGELITAADYPIDAIIRHAEGRTKFELAIDENGAPYSCRILESAKEPSLDRVTCDLFMARAKFQPASDAKGLPVRDTFTSAVQWRFPEDANEPFEASWTVLTIHSTASGVSHCDLREDDYVWPRLTRDHCLSMVGREVIELADRFKMAPHITFVTSFSPLSREAGEDGQNYGMLALEGVVALRIGPDGKVIHCQPVASKVALDLPPQLDSQPNHCDSFVPQDLKFTPADNPAEVRSGRLTTRLYIGPRDDNPRNRR